MNNNFIPNLTETVNLIPNPNLANAQKQVILFGRRQTGGKLILARNGYSQPNLYKPIQLQSYTDGTSATNSGTNNLSNYGLITVIGTYTTLPLVAPDNVSNSGSTTIITWNTPPFGFSQLTGMALNATLNQSSLNAQVISAYYDTGNIATMVLQGNVAFVTAGDSGAEMLLSGLNQINYPDPDFSDPITQMVWDFYQSRQSAVTPTDGYPNALLSIISDRDTTIQANSTPFNISNPDAVTVNPDESVYLDFNYTNDDILPVDNSGSPAQNYISNLTNFGYLPPQESGYGNTTLTQGIALPTDATNKIYKTATNFLRLSSDNAGIDYSDDGLTYNSSSQTTGTFNDVFANGSTCVACSNGGGLIRSNDTGVTWVATSQTSGTFKKVIYITSLSKWFATSTDGIFSSADSNAWTKCTGTDTIAFNGIDFGLGIIVAASTDDDVYTSSDGITFAANADVLATVACNEVTFGNGIFQISTTGNGIYNSTDGIIFLQSNLTTLNVGKIILGGSVWVAPTSNGIYNSNNGIAWNIATTGATTGQFNFVAFAFNKWIAGKLNGGLLYSTNGNATDYLASNDTTNNYLTAAYSSSLIVVGGGSGLTSSSGGVIWTTNNEASAIYGGLSIYPNSNGGIVRITLSNVTGSFVTTDPVTVVLDSTVDFSTFINNIEVYGAINQFPFTNSSSFIAQSAFYNLIDKLNQATQSMNKKYLVYGSAGNITTLPKDASTFPTRNLATNILVSYPYVYKFGNIPYENSQGNVAGARIAAAVMYMLANGDPAYPNLSGVYINQLPISSVADSTSYDIDTGNMAISRGILPLSPSNSVVTIMQSVTTLISYNSIPDTEFRYTHVWDVIRWIKREVALLYFSIITQPNNAGSVFISSNFLKNFKALIISILNQGQTLGMLQNVSLYSQYVTVIEDPNNVNQINASIPAQVIPALIGVNADINVFSASITQFNLSTVI